MKGDKMSYTLVVVDMQPKFASANHRRVIRNVKREISQAIADNADIVVLEYKYHGQTNRSIAKMVRSYDRGYFVMKLCDDGSIPLSQVVEIHNLSTNFRFVGVNYGACVRRTIDGLVSIGYNDIVVVEDACNQPIDWQDEPGFSWKDVRYDLVNNCGVFVENILTRC